MTRYPFVLVLALVCNAGCGNRVPTPEPAASPSAASEPTTGTPSSVSIDPAAYTAEIEAWRADYVANLIQDEGWFSLIGLYWLSPGENRCGSAADAVVVLPADRASPGVGSFDLEDGRVTFRPAPGSEVTVDGVVATAPRTVVTDADDAPSRFELGSLLWYVIVRGDKVGVRVKDRANESLASFAGIETYAPDIAWRVDAHFEPYDPPKEVPVPTVLETTTVMTSPGRLVFDVGGTRHRLDVLPGDSDRYWLIYGDASNARTTYGGGRFLYVPIPDPSGHTVIDFNKSYTPPCAYTPYATCPLPWPTNTLTVAVEAGEKQYTGAAGHG